MQRKIIDLSIYLENGVASDPPGLQPRITYHKHDNSFHQMAPFFPGTQTQSTTQTGNVTQPLYNNPWAGFLGGAQLASGMFG